MSNQRASNKGVGYQLEQLILEGNYKPGQKIPSERLLSEKLNVSRTQVREALKELQGRGVINTEHGKGSFVSGVIPEIANESTLMHLFQDHSRTLFDLLEVREQIEGQAAKLAAERANQQDLYRIKKAYKALEASDVLVDAKLDHAFHRAIAEASHNPVLIHLLNSLKNMTLKSVHVILSNLSHSEPAKQQIDKHHQKIYQEIMNHHPLAAQKAAMLHVKHVRESLMLVEQQGGEIIR